MTSQLPTDYAHLLAEVRQRIQHAQTRAVLAVNAEMVRLYWQVGQLLHARQAEQGWGTAVIPRLAQDLTNALPELKGFSSRNLDRMVAFARAYPCPADFSPQPVAQIPSSTLSAPVSLLWQVPWGHHALLLQTQKDPAVRRWYMEHTLAQGWSRSTLQTQIAQAAHTRQGALVNNFALRHAQDAPTIGLLLCQTKDSVLAEYALRGIDNPIGIASYELTRALPTTSKNSGTAANPVNSCMLAVPCFTGTSHDPNA